jgi:osmoprotectant transport system ATP-binding protein
MPRLPLHPELTLALGEVPPADAPDWMLVVEGGHPLGWVRTAGVQGAVDTSDLNRSGTVASLTASPREVLDAALSSPARRGVLVDDAGEFVGTVRASELATLLEAGQA